MKYLVLLLLFSIKAFCVTLPIETSYKVNLTWNAPTSSNDPISGYNMYRAEGTSTSFTLINSGLIQVLSYTDTTIANNTNYQYYATSVDAQSAESASSNTATVSIPFVPFPPTLGTLTAQ